MNTYFNSFLILFQNNASTLPLPSEVFLVLFFKFELLSSTDFPWLTMPAKHTTMSTPRPWYWSCNHQNHVLIFVSIFHSVCDCLIHMCIKAHKWVFVWSKRHEGHRDQNRGLLDPGTETHQLDSHQNDYKDIERAANHLGMKHSHIRVTAITIEISRTRFLNRVNQSIHSLSRFQFMRVLIRLSKMYQRLFTRPKQT